MDEPNFLVMIVAILTCFVGLPWLLLHYVTKWKQAPRITREDEQMLDEMFHLARRLEERVHTVERLVALDHPEARIGLDRRSADTGHDLTRSN